MACSLVGGSACSGAQGDWESLSPSTCRPQGLGASPIETEQHGPGARPRHVNLCPPHPRAHRTTPRSAPVMIPSLPRPHREQGRQGGCRRHLPAASYLLSTGSEGSSGRNHLIQGDPQGKVVHGEVVLLSLQELGGHETCQQGTLRVQRWSPPRWARTPGIAGLMLWGCIPPGPQYSPHLGPENPLWRGCPVCYWVPSSTPDSAYGVTAAPPGCDNQK